jgi:hypothetical protein
MNNLIYFSSDPYIYYLLIFLNVSYGDSSEVMGKTALFGAFVPPLPMNPEAIKKLTAITKSMDRSSFHPLSALIKQNKI